MALDWSVPYEAPTSLDGPRLVGPHSRRATLWAFVAFGSVALIAAICALLWVMLGIWEPFALLPFGLWLPFCYLMAQPLGQRTPEYWFRAFLRYKRLPRVIEHPYAALKVTDHALDDGETLRAVIEVDRTVNLRMAEDESLASAVKRLCAFYNGLRFPVQIVVKAWEKPYGIERRWFIAFTAPTPEVLDEHATAIWQGLRRLDLAGHRLNGDLFDSLQACWMVNRHLSRLGPSQIIPHRSHAIVDGEYVRGLLLGKAPRTTETNWLAPILDGDLPVDCCLWLTPLDNADELDDLAARISELKTAQILNVNSGRGEDPDIDDQIKDAARTRLLLQRRQLRVFQTTIGFVVRGKTEPEMLERERLLTDQLRELVGEPNPVVPADFMQHLTPLLAVPQGQVPVTYPIRMVTPALARTHPFSNSSLAMRDGVPCGTSTGSQRENRLSLFNPFSHAVVLGMTDAGKSFWVKVYVYRLLNAFPTVRTWIIQAERDEYRGLALALGARAQIITIRAYDELPRLVYEHSGAFRDFAQLVLYDLTRMPQQDKGKATAFLLDAIENTAKWFPKPELGTVVIDELAIVIEDGAAAVAIDKAYRRFRSIPCDSIEGAISRRAMIGVSQRPRDLLNHPRGQVLADMSKTRVYLRQQSTEMTVVKKALNLTADQVSFIENADQGTGLLEAAGTVVGFHLNPTAEELAMGRT